MKKNLIKFVSVLSSALLLFGAVPTYANYASTNPTTGIDCRIYSADKIAAGSKISGGLKTELITSDDKQYWHITTKSGQTADHIIFEPIKAGEGEYIPEFKFSEYPVVMIRYRSNIITTTRQFAINVGLKIAKTGKYERCWALRTEFLNNTAWNKVIIDARTFNGYDGGSAVAADVSPESGIKYVRFAPWVYTQQGVDTSEEYLDIEHIGFFKTVEDAENYGGRDSEPEMCEVTFADNKTVFGKSTYLVNASAAFPEAPSALGMKFSHWEDASGNKYDTVFAPSESCTYYAIYEEDTNPNSDGYALYATVKAAKDNSAVDHLPFIKGYDNNLFKPENNMTRAEACTAIARLLVDEESIESMNLSSSFADVKKGDWYYNSISYLESVGYLKSYSGNFEPDKKITRAEFVELVYAMGVTPAPTNMPAFSDVPETHPRYKVIMAAAGAGLVSGRPGGVFDPDGNIKRCEVVKVICNALGRTTDKNSFNNVELTGFADVPKTHWAYHYILESAFAHRTVIGASGEEIAIRLYTDKAPLSEAEIASADEIYAPSVDKYNSVLTRQDGFAKQNWTSDQIIEYVYEVLRVKYPESITRENIGNDASGSYDMWAYTFTPENYKHTVYIQGGVHGRNEIQGYMALARMMQLIYDDNCTDINLRNLRENVRFIVVPMVNVWDITMRALNNGQESGINKTFSPNNSNNVNLNRNWLAAEPEQEIKNIKALLTKYKDEIDFGIDQHTDPEGNPGWGGYLFIYSHQMDSRLAQPFIDLCETLYVKNKLKMKRAFRGDDLHYPINSKVDVNKTPEYETQNLSSSCSSGIFTEFGIPAITPEHGDRKFSGARGDATDMTRAVELYVNMVLTYVRNSELFVK